MSDLLWLDQPYLGQQQNRFLAKKRRIGHFDRPKSGQSFAACQIDQSVHRRVVTAPTRAGESANLVWSVGRSRKGINLNSVRLKLLGLLFAVADVAGDGVLDHEE
ncbi:hypothetical protein MWU53_01975 [Aliiroseovarius sp. S1123]|uniref:hypothetical protein n=1 Tax=unclassified Aliiroseovarius TaxID=2623558 RepID=UPI001FF5CAC3|nr:hypothetical protein [Aliiroseovarius sp. S1123]MCK0169816.1 hypothetical protein [Aliiroseovarius sp. S1123]